MKNKIVSILAASAMASSLLSGAVPVTAMADGTMVVSIGADLTEDQKTAILKYFGIYGNASVQTITVTNTDERNHLASYIPIEQIGSRTISCALVRPTTSGGVQVKTANLDYVTSNMIASNLITCGVTNCQAIAAAPFEVSGTGALTGILMAYESATGTQITQEAKDLSAQEIQITEGLTQGTGSQQVAQQIVNDVKLQVIDGVADNSITLEEVTDNSDNSDNSVDNSQVSNIVNNVVNNYTTNTDNSTTNTGLTEADVEKLMDYAAKLAQQTAQTQQQDPDSVKEQEQALTQNNENLQQQTGQQSDSATQAIMEENSSAQAETGDGSDTVPVQTSDDIFQGTDSTAIDSGNGEALKVTGTDEQITQPEISQGSEDLDKTISEENASADSQTTVSTGETASTDQTAASTGETASTDQTAAPTTETASGEQTAAPADGTVTAETDTAPADQTAAPAITITADQTDSYAAAYTADYGQLAVPAFAVALKADNLVPVSGTFTVADESGNVLGTVDLSQNKDQVIAVSSGTANDQFRSANGWDAFTGLFFQVKDASGAVITPAEGTVYSLTLNATFAQTTDPSQTEGAPVVAADLENISYTAPASYGLSVSNPFSDLYAGAGAAVTAYVTDDGSFASAAVSSPDGLTAVSTLAGDGTVAAGSDTSASVQVLGAGLAEIDVTYYAAAPAADAAVDPAAAEAATEGAADAVAVDAAAPAEGTTVVYLLPVAQTAPNA